MNNPDAGAIVGRILFVEDSPHDRIAFRRVMTGWAVTECEHADEAELWLAREQFDLIVVDDHLPGPSGLELCRAILRRKLEVPVVIVTGRGSEGLAVEALKAGVADYIIKDHSGDYLDLLPLVLPEVVTQHREHNALRRAEADLDENRIRLAQIVDGSPVATFVLDAEHRVTHWNRACAAMTGVSAAETIGTRKQWRAFYPSERPVMADLIIDGVTAEDVQRHYAGKWRRSDLIDGAFEAEDFFPALGDTGRWLYFTAAPLRDSTGRILGAIETLQDFTERRVAEAALRVSESQYRQLAMTDGLTGLHNSRHFYEQLTLETKRAERYGRTLSLLLIDADHFKEFNDRHGHLAGDKALQALANCIKGCLRRSDSAYRYGGEEFTVLLPETTIDAAQQLAERVRIDFAATPLCPRAGITAHGTVSIGVAEFHPGEAGEDFVRRADRGAYQAKDAGRDRVVVVRD